MTTVASMATARMTRAGARGERPRRALVRRTCVRRVVTPVARSSTTRTAPTMATMTTVTTTVTTASGARARRDANAPKRTAVRALGAKDADALVAAMRAQVAATNANPSVANIVQTLCELAEQDYGLTGVKFNEVMAKVDECYAFSPTEYVSGKGTAIEVKNAPGTNNGSCKTFYFAKLHNLSPGAALRLFCEHYEDVLATPDGDSHANIRAFMANGWDGISFAGEALRMRDGSESVNDV